MEIVIIAQVVTTWTMRLYQESTSYSVNPYSCVLDNNFKAVSMGVDVVKTILIISHYNSNFTVIACWNESEGSKEINKQSSESISTCSESI